MYYVTTQQTGQDTGIRLSAIGAYWRPLEDGTSQGRRRSIFERSMDRSHSLRYLPFRVYCSIPFILAGTLALVSLCNVCVKIPHSLVAGIHSMITDCAQVSSVHKNKNNKFRLPHSTQTASIKIKCLVKVKNRTEELHKIK